MTTSELIAELQKLPPDMPVFAQPAFQAAFSIYCAARVDAPPQAIEVGAGVLACGDVIYPAKSYVELS